MQDNQSNKGESRRDFFRSLIGEVRKAPVQDSDALQAMKRRASVLALRYAQKEADLTQIGVEEPKKLGNENHLYKVKVTGYTQNSVSTGIMLHVDIAKGIARIPEPDPEPED
jgi:hypothetical protein